jgi:photosystem II stability/assembly factor-like uncharacterized protein
MTRRRIAVVLLGVAGGLVFSAAGSAPAAPEGGVSAAFGPFAASFLSPSTGFVLGGVGCQFGVNGIQRPCKPVLVATSDGGLHWRAVSSPPTTLQPTGALGLSGPYVRAITFADSRNGWLFGPGLWATHDGGDHWERIAIKGTVLAVVANAGWAYATTYSVGAHSSLFRSAVAHDDWQPVSALAGTVGSPIPLLAAYGRAAWVGVLPLNAKPPFAPDLWRSADGSHWQRIGNPCAGASESLVSIAATSATGLVMSCGGPEEIVTSADGGIHTRRITPPGIFAGRLAAPLGQSKIIVLDYPTNLGPPGGLAVHAQSWIDRTANDGRSWTRTPYNDRGVGWADLEFVSPTVAWVVHGFPGESADQLMRSTDAGASFKPVRF